MKTQLAFVIDDIVGHASVDLLKGYTSLKAGERRTQAEGGAVSEAEVSVGGARDVENLSRRSELAIVVVRSTDEQQHRVSGPQRLAVTLDVGR